MTSCDFPNWSGPKRLKNLSRRPSYTRMTVFVTPLKVFDPTYEPGRNWMAALIPPKIEYSGRSPVAHLG